MGPMVAYSYSESKKLLESGGFLFVSKVFIFEVVYSGMILRSQVLFES